MYRISVTLSSNKGFSFFAVKTCTVMKGSDTDDIINYFNTNYRNIDNDYGSDCKFDRCCRHSRIWRCNSMYWVIIIMDNLHYQKKT